MLHKKQELTVSNRRSVTTFFNRMMEQFERKFDGFPASVEGGAMPAVTEDTHADYTGVEIDITDYLDKPQCPDVVDPATNCVAGCSGEVVTTDLEYSDGSYSAPYDVDYYVSVWWEGVIMVKDEDYTVNEDKTITFNMVPIDSQPSVTARYMVA